MAEAELIIAEIKSGVASSGFQRSAGASFDNSNPDNYGPGSKQLSESLDLYALDSQAKTAFEGIRRVYEGNLAVNANTSGFQLPGFENFAGYKRLVYSEASKTAVFYAVFTNGSILVFMTYFGDETEVTQTDFEKLIRAADARINAYS